MGKKTSKSSTDPSKFAKPYISGAANAVRGDFLANKDSVDNIAKTVQGGIPSLALKAFGTNPMLAAAQSYNTDVLGGKYLDQGNPFLADMIAQTNDDVTNRVSGAIGARGRTGGNSHSEILGRELAKNETGLRFANYGSERDAMASAAGMAPGLVNAEFAGIAPLLGVAQAGAELPFMASNNYAQNMAALMGNYTTTKEKKAWGPMLLQAMSNGAQAAASGGTT